VLQPTDGEAPTGTLRLRIHVGVGQAVIDQQPAVEEGASR
jgi:hypothetical protein